MVADPLDIARVEAAAAAFGGPAIELIRRQEVNVLNKLLEAYRKGSLDAQDALVGIGVINELRRLQATLRRAVLAGDEAASNLIEGNPS